MNITMYRGDDKAFPFTLTQGGVTQTLTGAVIVFTARLASEFAEDEAPALSLSTAGGDIVIAADQVVDKGEVTVTIPSADSVDLVPGLYLCDIEVTLGGNVWTWPEPVYGQSSLIRLRVKRDATHA